jgi:hypothetical protein
LALGGYYTCRRRVHSGGSDRLRTNFPDRRALDVLGVSERIRTFDLRLRKPML